MINKNDLSKIEETILDIKDMRDKGIKARKDIALSDDTVVSIYHLGKNNKTIRLDLKL